MKNCLGNFTQKRCVKTLISNSHYVASQSEILPDCIFASAFYQKYSEHFPGSQICFQARRNNNRVIDHVKKGFCQA